MRSYGELEALIIAWAAQKGILENGTPIAQCDKTFEEVEELTEALEAQRMGLKNFKNKKENNVLTAEEIKDALGDILVTIIIQAEMQGLSLIDCLESAYNVISKRTGKMVGGQFVKNDAKEMIPPISGGVRTITDHIDFAIKNQSHT